MNGEHALADAGVRGERDWLDGWTAGEGEGRRNVVERPLRDCLKEREHRRREGCGDTGHFDPDQTVTRANHGPVGESTYDAEPRTEVVLVKLASRARHAVLTQVFSCCLSRLKTAD